jgi:hypothetical protein
MKLSPCLSRATLSNDLLDSVAYKSFARTVCSKGSCYQKGPVSDGGVTADLGAGWIYFLLERHFKTAGCVSKDLRVSEICDALAVPLQESRRKLVFLELKARGKTGKAVKQIRKGVEAVNRYSIPNDVALFGEIWHMREPKTSLRSGRYEEVDGRKILIRHRRAC